MNDEKKGKKQERSTSGKVGETPEKWAGSPTFLGDPKDGVDAFFLELLNRIVTEKETAYGKKTKTS